jgi:hypothetical protein
MSLNKYKTLLLGLATLGVMFENPKTGGYFDSLSADEVKDLDKARERNRLNRLKEQGVQEWHIDGFIVWARNDKNAIRKVNNAKKFIQQNS